MFVALLLINFLSISCAKEVVSCKRLYDEGVMNYLDADYEGCVDSMESALELYRNYIRKIEQCRIKCHDQAKHDVPLYQFDVDDLRFYERTIKNTLCLIQCKDNDEEIFAEFDLGPDDVKPFQQMKPYEYLHLCYFQTKEYQKAATAAFTYLVAHPNDESAIRNMKHYLTLPKVESADIINREAKDYVYLFTHGVDAYTNKNWNAVIQNMEESLFSYLQAEDECRVMCEGPFNQGWFPDLIPTIANHFTHALRCKQNCKSDLSQLNGEARDDLLASHYHYLQYAYFKTGNLQAACEAATSYLLFFPTHEAMLYNIEYYKKMPKAVKEFFRARKEAIYYHDRDTYEQRILKFVTKSFTDSTTVEKYAGLHVLADRKRVILDNVINAKLCEKFVRIVDEYGVPGDGYDIDSVSPHTSFETFKGLSFAMMKELVEDKRTDSKMLRQLIKLRFKVKNILSSFFELKKRLYYNFTHLVCRSTSSEFGNITRHDLSHPVHSDNCNLKRNGECPKEPPAFTWRDYTAIIYLNSDFRGGELFFARDFHGEHREVTVSPSCGKFVGFSSGGENLHGVNAVTAGMRCALAIWFTHDRNEIESART